MRLHSKVNPRRAANRTSVYNANKLAIPALELDAGLIRSFQKFFLKNFEFQTGLPPSKNCPLSSRGNLILQCLFKIRFDGRDNNSPNLPMLRFGDTLLVTLVEHLEHELVIDRSVETIVFCVEGTDIVQVFENLA